MIDFSKIRWKNFLSTGYTFSEFDFDQSPSTLVIGENGSGKSTMLDALTYGLYSKPFRKVNKPQLVNSVNEKGMLVEVEFSSGSKSYLVRRGVYRHGDQPESHTSEEGADCLEAWGIGQQNTVAGTHALFA